MQKITKGCCRTSRELWNHSSKRSELEIHPKELKINDSLKCQITFNQEKNYKTGNNAKCKIGYLLVIGWCCNFQNCWKKNYNDKKEGILGDRKHAVIHTKNKSAQRGARTPGLKVKSLTLYRLSYLGDEMIADLLYRFELFLQNYFAQLKTWWQFINAKQEKCSKRTKLCLQTYVEDSFQLTQMYFFYLIL